MSTRTFTCALLGAATLALAPLAMAQSTTHDDHHAHAAHVDHAEHAEHEHHGHGSDALPATPWATDAPLRENMRRVRKAVGSLEHYEHGHLDAAEAAKLAGDIQDAVNAMFANCKLEAEADAALHGLLANFITGARAVRTEAEVPTEAIAKMREALARYPLMFDDPAWSLSDR